MKGNICESKESTKFEAEKLGLLYDLQRAFEGHKDAADVVQWT
jgi:hypothetical protein